MRFEVTILQGQKFERPKNRPVLIEAIVRILSAFANWAIVRVRSIWLVLALRTPCRPAILTSALYSPVRGGTHVLPQRRRPRRTRVCVDHPFVRSRITLR